MVSINGVVYSGGNNVKIIDNNIFIDGKQVKGSEAKDITIIVNEPMCNISIDNAKSVKVSGNTGSVQSTSGDIVIHGEVAGDLKTTSGDITCGHVKGNATTVSGDIDCENVGGKVKTLSGDIKHK